MAGLKRICMMSIHGYFDAEPILGATDTGGQVTYVLELSKHLAGLGVEVDIYTRQFGERPEEDAVSDGVRIIRIPCGPADFVRKEDLLPYLDEMTDKLEAHVERHSLEYDLIHSHYWDAGYVGMNIAERLGLPFIYTAHSLGAWKKEQMGGDAEEMEKLFKFAERVHWENEIFRRAKAQTVTTKDGKDTYKRLYDFESPTLIIIPPGVDTSRFRPLLDGESDQPLDVPKPFVFALSRIDSNKGLDYLIRAFALVRERSNVHLVIGGGSKNPKALETEVKTELDRLVDSLDLAKRVTFTGYVPDELLDTYYRETRVFVLPSKYEPFGMTVLEAMACGTPVVATKLGGIRHVLADGKNSLLVDPSRSDDLANAIMRLLVDDDFAGVIAQRGLDLIRERFSWDRIAQQTLDFYNRYA